MSRRETAAEREARMMRAAAGRQEDEPRRRPANTVRTKPVRTTVDLAPELHRQLKRWLADAADELEITEVPLASAMRVLIRLLVDDEKLAAEVLEDLRSLTLTR
jgi:hypothetical protein